MLKFHSLRVAEVQPDAEDAVAVALDVPAELQPEYAGLPGQHVVLRAFLDGEEERRTYSLINAPGEWPMRIVARVHKYGRMSRHIAQDVKVGDRIDVLPPNGSLTPRLTTVPTGSRATRTYVGFAAGCGITPVLSVAKAILRADVRSHFILLYGNTSTGRVMCMEELLGLKDRYLEQLALHFVMSREPQEVELYNGRIDAARVREVAGILFEPDQVAEYFVCGPGDMIQQVSGVLRELGVGAERIHGEHFTVDAEKGGTEREAGTTGDEAGAAVREANAVHGTGAGHEAASRPSDAVEVTVLIDGRRRTFTMKRNDDTILDAATRAGLELPYSCRAGVCSTCRTKVVSGKVAMDQNYALEDWELEQGYILACQSRVKTPALELDYDEK